VRSSETTLRVVRPVVAPALPEVSALPEPALAIAGVAQLPSQFGEFRIFGFGGASDGKEHVAIVRGEIEGHEDVLTRLHSECLTGDVLGSLRCDCREQLELSLRRIAQAPRGVVLYLRQEGRGIGLINKIRAYGLQEQGLDTVDANRALGFRDDERDFGVASAMLRTLGVKSVALMTNNPEKVRQLEQGGVVVARRVAHEIPPGVHNRFYLQTKARRSGHWLEIGAPDDEPAVAAGE
jgi:GTP cyclohydrolase II